MKVKFYGTRGSVPVSEARFLEFGGNTTCVCISSLDSEDIIILDAGTGIRNLGKEIADGILPVSGIIYMVFSHFHWDHIQGFPFFAPAYNPDRIAEATTNHFDIWSHYSHQGTEKYFHRPDAKPIFSGTIRRPGCPLCHPPYGTTSY